MLSDSLLASAEEVRARAAANSKPSYSADISYLDNASTNFLAAKLARLGREETIVHKEGSPEHTLPNEVRRPAPTPEDVAALTAKRREDRINRANQHLLNYVPIPETSEFLRSEFAKSNVFLSPERNSFKGGGNLSRRSPWQGPPGVARRLNERSRKQNEQDGFSKRPKGKQNKRRAPVAQATQNVTSSFLEDQIDEAVFKAGHEPEFKGPDPSSSNLLEHFGPGFSPKGVIVVAQSGTAFRIPVSKVDSFDKGDYSRYVSSSKEDYASPPDALGAVKVAERALSHQRHYNLTARDRTLELVAQASPSSKPIAKVTSRR
jgi:hypothetical protein